MEDIETQQIDLAKVNRTPPVAATVTPPKDMEGVKAQRTNTLTIMYFLFNNEIGEEMTRAAHRHHQNAWKTCTAQSNTLSTVLFVLFNSEIREGKHTRNTPNSSKKPARPNK